MTDRQFQKLEKRVQRIFDKFPNKVKRMIFDDEKNLYGEFVKNAGYNSELNIAYYVVLGKKIYIMTLNHDFTRSYAVMLYRKTIFGDVDIDIKIYDPENDTPLFDNVLELRSLIEFMNYNQYCVLYLDKVKTKISFKEEDINYCLAKLRERQINI